MEKRLAILTSLCLLIIGCLTLPAQAQDRTLSPAGKAFIKDAASASKMEVLLGRVARDRGNSQEVKDFGDLMVLEHTRASQELNLIAAQRNLKLPVLVERKHTPLIAKLSKLSGSEFDKMYMLAMVKHHASSIARFKRAIDRVRDQELRAWTVLTLPVLQQHLQLAKELALKLGGR